MFSQYIQKYYDLAVNTYHVNPVTFLVIYLISVPVFYFAFYKVVRILIFEKKNNKTIKFQNLLRRRDFIVWSSILLIDYLAPYLYIAIFGDNLPVWVWVPLGLVILYTALSLVIRIRNQLKNKIKPKN